MTAAQSTDTSAFSSEKVLDRLSAARGQASKEANRLFLASFILAGLYLIKASGLRVDLTLLETNVAKVPHGLFFFLVASQVSMILSYMRSADSTAINSRLRDAIESYGVQDVEASERTYVNEYEWFAPTEAEFSRQATSQVGKIFFGLTGFVTSITALIFYILPSIAGFYTLYNYQSMIQNGNIDLQYWVLFGTTCLSTLWFFNFIAVYVVVRK